MSEPGKFGIEVILLVLFLEVKYYLNLSVYLI